ncbi:SusC/RagA family TonB-linked outer membrane protein [Niabella hirudinis]|uniref:SusC/RagA family TonB-linked outer membrane protein n=1 Tax=Niabella hirudinis TaxID=1285929 RepID=UPI003EC0F892
MLQEDIEVSGLVTDSARQILSGVSVTLKSKQSIGTTTDLNGRFVLKVPANDILVFTMSGYTTKEVPVGNNTTIDVVMQKDIQLLEETVVVAFGNRAKKRDLIGAVTSVSVSELQIPSSNLTTALQGRVAGMISYQRSGEPGLDNADFFIRGVGTFGVNQQPLILVDNMEMDINDLARIPWDNLESFSVLKDASASAMYGARAANGVIIVTTKRGKDGPAKVNLRAEQRISAPTQNLKIADPVTFMKMNREAILTRDPLGKDNTYSLEKIDKTIAGDDPILYPAVDWLDFITRKVTTTQNYNLGVSGGGQLARYNVSANYTTDNGLLKIEPINDFNSNVRFNVFDFLSNVDINLTKSTQLVARVKANIQDYNGPPSSGSAAYGNAIRSNPVLFLPVYTPGESQSYIKHPMFGNYANGGYLNAYAEIVKGYSEKRRSNLSFQTELTQDLAAIITEGLKFRGMLNITRKSYFEQSRQYKPFYYSPIVDPVTNRVSSYFQINPKDGTEYLDFVPGNRDQTATLYGEAQFLYNRTFAEKHGLTGSLIGTLRSNVATPTDNDISLINTLPYRNVSFSGNFSYAYDERYYAQFTFGYNGSERFAADSRWGFFPSFGVAWTVSKEKFMEGLWPVISNLRFRATHGWVGNDNISNTRFFYLSDVNLNDGGKRYAFGLPTSGQYAVNGVSIRRYENPFVQWEISRQTNLGIDLGMFKGALTFTGEFYRQFRYNIVQDRAAIPSSTGLQAAVLANLGKYESKGFEGELAYTKSVNKNLFFQGRGTFTYATGHYVYYEEPAYQYAYLSRIGLNARQQTGYIAERLFIDDNEVLNSPEQQFGGAAVLGGDIKYVDANNDGVINSNDLVPIGQPTTPEITYGFGLTTGYKSFDLSFFFSGIARTSLFISPVYYNGSTQKYGVAPFGSATAPNAVLQAWADSYWSEENQNIYAQWPRLSQSPTTNNIQNSTYWMRNGNLLRLKQVELGYNLKQNLLKKYRMNTLRIYFSGTNLFKWSPFKLWDPEMGGNGLAYPLQRVFNFGININI